MSRRAAGERGQATIEALALVPLLVLVLALVWQLAGLVHASIVAQDRARADALAATGHGNVTVRSRVTVPSLVPGVARLTVPVRAVVRAP